MIDLTKIPLGQVETYYEEYRLKSAALFSALLSRNSAGYNRIVVPMAIYNLIVTNDGFRWSGHSAGYAGPHQFGECLGFECVLDMRMRHDEVLLCDDMATMRDRVIGGVLGARPPKQKKLRVKI